MAKTVVPISAARVYVASASLIGFGVGAGFRAGTWISVIPVALGVAWLIQQLILISRSVEEEFEPKEGGPCR